MLVGRAWLGAAGWVAWGGLCLLAGRGGLGVAWQLPALGMGRQGLGLAPTVGRRSPMCRLYALRSTLLRAGGLSACNRLVLAGPGWVLRGRFPWAANGGLGVGSSPATGAYWLCAGWAVCARVCSLGLGKVGVGSPHFRLGVRTVSCSCYTTGPLYLQLTPRPRWQPANF